MTEAGFIFKVSNRGGVIFDKDNKAHCFFSDSAPSLISLPWRLADKLNGGGTHPPEDFDTQKNWPSGKEIKRMLQ